MDLSIFCVDLLKNDNSANENDNDKMFKLSTNDNTICFYCDFLLF